MATLTKEQIEQKKQRLHQLAEEVKQLKDELVEAGACPMDEDDLDNVAGGIGAPIFDPPGTRAPNPPTHHSPETPPPGFGKFVLPPETNH